MPIHYPSNFPLDKASPRYYTYWELLLSKFRLLDRRIKAGKAVIVDRDVEFRMSDNARISIGDHTTIARYVYIFMTKPNPELIVGSQVGIGRYCQINAKRLIEIGDYTRIGSFTTIRDNIHEPFHNKDEKVIETHSKIEPVKIGKNVWIGQYCTIFPGVAIGDNAVISTYAVVTKDVEPMTVVAGQPARPVKLRSLDAG